MVFSSSYFVFIFLPLALILCLSVSRRLFLWSIFAVSLFFYFWSSGPHVLILISIILINFVGAQLVRGKSGAFIFATFISLNVLALFTFKYLSFVIRNVDAALSTDLSSGVGTIVLPAGISFFIFQGISYLTDVRRGEVPAEKKLSVYGAYQAFFPHLIAGPIVRFRDVMDDLLHPKLSASFFAAGATRFAHGLVKKVVLADSIAPIADAAFSLPPEQIDFYAAWVGAIAYALQIYFDFSGYSDMAIGMAAMFGIRFKENFVRPYSSRSVTEFWRRWHVTLSSWFRDYVYIPLGGSRCGPVATYRNLLIVFLITGLWHGAAWTFVLWGFYHGAFLVLERAIFRDPIKRMTHSSLRYLYCLPVIIFGWTIFRAHELEQALDMWGAMLQPHFLTGTQFWTSSPDISPYNIAALLLGSGIFVLGRNSSLGARLMDHPRGIARQAGHLAYTVGAVLISGVIVLTGGYSPFLYFTF